MDMGETIRSITGLLGVAGSITTLVSLAALSVLVAYLLGAQWLRGKSSAARLAIEKEDDRALARLLGGTAVPLDTLSPDQKFSLASEELRTRYRQRIIAHALLFFGFLALLGFGLALAVNSPAGPAASPPRNTAAVRVEPLRALEILRLVPRPARAQACVQLLSAEECAGAATLIQAMDYQEPTQQQGRALEQALTTGVVTRGQLQELAACGGTYEFRVENNRLLCADGTAIPNVAVGQARRPLTTADAIVIHATESSDNSLDAAARLIASGREDLRGPLGHVLISRSGAVVQTAPFNETAFHVGRSRPWLGMPVTNANSIGLQLIGRPSSGQGYTAEQIAAATGIARALFQAYRMQALVGHSEVADPPGRKSDPGPLFPIDALRRAVEPPR